MTFLTAAATGDHIKDGADCNRVRRQSSHRFLCQRYSSKALQWICSIAKHKRHCSPLFSLALRAAVDSSYSCSVSVLLTEPESVIQPSSWLIFLFFSALGCWDSVIPMETQPQQQQT